MRISRVGSFTTGWGESLAWDETRERLYFVDCAAHQLMWLDGTAEEPESFKLPSMPTGVVLTTTNHVVVVLDDGLYLFDPDAQRVELLSLFPDEIGGRCIDACADFDGNLITGKLNFEKAPGSVWQFSSTGGWSILDSDISNTNGPAVLGRKGDETLVIGDTAADYFAFDYEASTATASARRLFGDMTDLDGRPDGTTVDADDGVWCALVGGAQLARFTNGAEDATVALPARNPTDVAFGGADMNRLYITTIDGDGDDDGALLVIDGLAQTGRPAPRFRLGA